MEWCVFTNGDEYRIYNVQAAVYVDEKLFRTIRVSEPDQSTLEILDLLSKRQMAENSINVYWKSDFVDRKVKEAVYDLFRNQDRKLVNLIAKKSNGLRVADIRLTCSPKSARFQI